MRPTGRQHGWYACVAQYFDRGAVSLRMPFAAGDGKGREMAEGVDTKLDSTIAVLVNGEARQVGAATLAALLEHLGYGGQKVATALNGDFIAARLRGETPLRTGDEIEIVAARQGG